VTVAPRRVVPGEADLAASPQARWTGATAGFVRGTFQPGSQGLIPQEKQSLSAIARRLAGPGVFPYNTAPAPPAQARRHGNVFPQSNF
jgi:hypothetical protein